MILVSLYLCKMDNIIEAHRYIDNAKEMLREKGQKDGRHYNDKKYVKLAGHAAYTGILLALDGYFQRGKRTRKNVDWYKAELSKIDKKLLASFNSAYELLHLNMGYDGATNVMIASAGLEDAEEIINWIEQRQH